MTKDMPRKNTCAGCGGLIAQGTEALVTVQSGNHVITVYAHNDHREAAWAKTMERSDWKRNQSYHSG